MRLKYASRMLLGLWLLGAALPAVVSAQSTITGRVSDDTGGVLPGVTVVAASAALIEGSRTAVTDGQGVYTIIDLRPGVYTLSFSLTGFSGVRREGLELPSNFTATINAELRLGALEETIVVSGASPIIDAQSVQRTQVLRRDLLDAVPTARTPWSMASLVLGVKMIPDVGGAAQTTTTQISGIGLGAKHTTTLMDGFMVNGFHGDGGTQSYPNNATIEEATVQMGGASAEVSAGGPVFSMILRSGGNKFGGSAWLSRTDGDWVSDNVTPALRQRGLSIGSSVTEIHDVTLALGGPIIRDKLWFFESPRWTGTDLLVANTFFDNGEQARTNDFVNNFSSRLTWQASRRDKITVFYDRAKKYLKYGYIAPLQDPETGAGEWLSNNYYIGQVKWTSTKTNRLLLEAGYSANTTSYTIRPQPGIKQPRPEGVRTCLATPCFWEAAYDQSTPWYRQASKRDLTLGTQWNAVDPENWLTPIRRVVMGAMSYVTGSHNVKTGVQWMFGTYGKGFDANADLQQQYQVGVPTSVLISNTPVINESRLNRDLALYAQDMWKIARLTANVGIRLEWFNASTEPGASAAGRFASSRQFAGIANRPDWFDVSPRLGASYDLFGTGRTALKVTFSKFMYAWTTGVADRYDPMVFANDTRTWTDRDRLGRDLPTNGDDIAQDNEIGPSSNTQFGIRSQRNPDPDLRREYNLEYSAGFDHEILRGLGVATRWYRRTSHRLETQYNLLRTLNDWTPVTVYSPLDGTSITAYNLDPRKRGLVDLIDTNSTDSDLRRNEYTGFETSANARLPFGTKVFGGWTAERIVNVTCNSVDDPNTFRFCNQGGVDRQSGIPVSIPFLHEFKVAGTQSLPAGFDATIVLSSIPGFANSQVISGFGPGPYSVKWRVTPTTRYAANCKGACTPGALVIPNMTEPALVLQLTPPGVRYWDRRTQLDLGVRKTFTVGRLQLTGQFDLFNALNAAPVLDEIDQFGPTLGLPLRILTGRLPRVAAQLKW